MATNRLAQQTSPYLLQHASNPVQWYPWGKEALDLAAKEDRPILLSVGYAACHWCHVMERESFENLAIAELMNRHFVCIKVDREERPDIDDIYMAATVAMNGSGGWPMTVFLTPEQTPFFAGTYFPPHDTEHSLGFSSLLGRIADLWTKDRDGLFRQAAELTEHIQAQSRPVPPRDVEGDATSRAVESLNKDFDEQWGGFGGAPKFPQAALIELLIRYFHRTGDERAHKMACRTLDAMKDGGLFDQLGGGFARYSTDERWLVPHFEKMLYDNAQLTRLYLEASQAFGSSAYRYVASETLAFICREMQDTRGGYYSSLDADADGEEGQSYVFSESEIRAALTESEAKVFCAHFGVSTAGNWEGKNVLHVAKPGDSLAKELGLTPVQFVELLHGAKRKLFSLRAERVQPAVDDKVVTSWNGLMIGGMAEGYRVLQDRKWLDSANRAAAFLKETHFKDDRLLRTSRAGKASLNAYLEDYAFLIDGLLTLYEAAGDSSHLRWAEQLATRMLADFADSSGGAFYQTSVVHDPLIVRSRDGQDGALPNANAVAALGLARLSHLLSKPAWLEIARGAIRAYGQRIERNPRAFASSLNVAEFLFAQPVELVLAGDTGRALQTEIAEHYLPFRVIAHVDTSFGMPLTQGRAVDGEAALFICKNSQCELPAKSVGEARPLLQNASKSVYHARPQKLGAGRISGRATPEGTQRFFSTRRLPAAAGRQVADTGLRVSRLGFGGYRIHQDVAEHHRALSLALAEGANLIDTAGTYTGGASELLIGSALAEQIQLGKLCRDEVVITTKAGIIPLRKGESPGSADSHALNPSLSYSLHPSSLERQLTSSLERLGLETVDILLLHNPEMLLSVLDRPVVLQQLSEAFRWLEQEVEAGRIGVFGVSSNTLGAAGGFTLSELSSAQQAAGAAHFKVLQVPLNPVELGAASASTVEGGGESLLEQANGLGLAVFTNRPLNGLAGDTLVRLADAPSDLKAPDWRSSKEEVAKLEHEFRNKLGAVLLAVPDVKLPVGEFFTWAERIGDYEVSSRELWDEFERDIIGAQLPPMIVAMNEAFTGKQLSEVWKEWRSRYTRRFEDWVLAARARASAATNARNLPFSRVLRASAPNELKTASLSRLVLWNLSSVDGVSAALVGMRTTAHVQDAMGTLRWPEAAEPSETLLEAQPSLIELLPVD